MSSNLDVGSTIKKIRKEKNITIKDLATKAKITSSMLSQIEHGTANPSLNTIRTIAQVLDVPIFKFFIVQEDLKPNTIIKKSSERMHIKTDKTDIEMLNPKFNDTSIEFMVMTLYPGQDSSSESISHIGEEVDFIESGKALLFIEDECYEVEQGDTINIAPNVKHRWINNSNEPVVVYFVVTPPSY